MNLVMYKSAESINPSPLFCIFDYGNFKIFGSSPEPGVDGKSIAKFIPLLEHLKNKETMKKIKG
jgi:hypothetical protein